jgi:amino acid transporter
MHGVTTEREKDGPKLRRDLTLWGLVIYGIILIQPTAPMPLFGVVSQEARGHVVTTVLIAMIAMLFAAISYGRMARAYPSAGSAFTYVGREFHPALGYVTGWSMAMDYMLNPILCTIWCSKAAGNIVPEIPYALWALFFALLFPRNNVIFVGGLALVGAFVLTYQLAAEMLNFGAFIAFMGVNAAAFRRYFLRGKRTIGNCLPPLAGFAICLYIWLSLRTPAKLAGGVWLAAGTLYGAWKTRGFRVPVASFEVPPDESDL